MRAQEKETRQTRKTVEAKKLALVKMGA